MAEEKFQSIYGDAESEFDVEDVSDETLSISKEEIEETLEEEKPAEEPAPAEETPVEEEKATEEETPAEEKPSTEKEEAKPSEPEEEHEIEGVSFEENAPIHDEDDIVEKPAEDQKISIISYILHAILFTIPVIGTILMLIYIISDKKDEHLRHFAQIWLITLVVIAVGIHAAIIILGI